jgi:O-antigen ligase
MPLLLMTIALVAGLRWPGVLLAGTLFSYQAEALSERTWVTSAYALAGAAVALIRSFARHEPLPPLNRIDALFGLFILLYAASVAYARNPASALMAAQQLLLSAGSMYLLGRLTITPDRFDSVLRELLAATIAFSVAFSFLMLGAQARAKAEFVGLAVVGSTTVGLSQPMPLSACAGLAALFGLADKRRWWLFVLVGAATAFTLYVSMLNARRGVFLAFAVGAIAMACFARRHLHLGRALVAFVVAALGLAVSVPELLASRSVQDSLGRLLWNFQGGGVVADASARGRHYRIEKALDLFYVNPAVGSGLGGYDQATGLGYPHNMLAEVGANFGLVGLTLLSAWLIALVFRAMQLARSRAYGVALFGLLITTLVHAQMSFGFFMLKPLFLISGMIASTRLPNGGRRTLLTAHSMQRGSSRGPLECSARQNAVSNASVAHPQAN